MFVRVDVQITFDPLHRCSTSALHRSSDVYSFTVKRIESELEALEAQRPRWRYKLPEQDEYGPFSSAAMYSWVEQSAFPDTLLVQDTLGERPDQWAPITETELWQ